ncbi:MAG: PKD domain-containing protein [Pseudomonadota bacterium]
MNRGNMVVATLLALCLIGAARVAWGGSVGGTGYAKAKAPPVCGGCHTGGAAPQVRLSGPDEVAPGSWNPYELTVKNPGQKAGGFNVAATGGKLISWTLRVKPDNGELVHNGPVLLEKDGSLLLEFDWIAPQESGEYEITAAIASVDQDGTPRGDGVTVYTHNVRVSGRAREAKDARAAGEADGSAPAGAGDKAAPATRAPNAQLSAPGAGIAGESLFFSGIGSSDPDGSLTAYQWDFGDGAVMRLPAGMHSYAEEGAYAVTLTVTDNEGLSASDHTTITIQGPQGDNRPPTASAGGPYQAGLGKPVQFDGRGSRDSDGSIESFAWDFGDGQTGAGALVSHTYSRPGAYTARLTVKDDKGLPGNALASVIIRARADVMIGKFNVAKRIEILEDEAKTEDIVVKSLLQGVEADHTECGKAYLLRNEAVVQQQVVCYQGEGPAFSTFPVKFTALDAPEVRWASYIELDAGTKTETVRKKTAVGVAKSR